VLWPREGVVVISQDRFKVLMSKVPEGEENSGSSHCGFKNSMNKRRCEWKRKVVIKSSLSRE